MGGGTGMKGAMGEAEGKAGAEPLKEQAGRTVLGPTLAPSSSPRPSQAPGRTGIRNPREAECFHRTSLSGTLLQASDKCHCAAPPPPAS